MLLFKYLSPDGAKKVFEEDGSISLRFSLPKMYNDPYELFLQTDRPFGNKEIRAFFDFFLGDVLEAPVTCFSRCPDSVVLWAHYGRDGLGVCLGYDEDKLANQFSLAYIDDVSYSNKPATINYEYIEWAFETGKRRHSLFLLEEANRAAFFLKRDDWQYEKERRLVVMRKDVEEIENHYIAKVDPSVLKYIILGTNSTPEIQELCKSRAEQYNVILFHQKVGKRYFQPFFQGVESGTTVWNGKSFEKCEKVCDICFEPAESLENGICEWCIISDEKKTEEGYRSLLTSTISYGYDDGIPFRFADLDPKGYQVNQETPDE